MDCEMQDLHHNIEPATTHPASRVDYTPLILDTETIAALKELGNALAAVHLRLISEGCVIQKGIYVAPGTDR